MKFYAAGKFDDYLRVRETIDLLNQWGHAVTHDWTRTAEFGADGHPLNRELSKEKLQQYAREDLKGAMEADFLVVLADRSLCGAWIEVGAALASPTVKRIFVVAPDRWTIFLEDPKVVLVPDLDVLCSRHLYLFEEGSDGHSQDGELAQASHHP